MIYFNGTRSRVTKVVNSFAVLAAGRVACLFFSHRVFPVYISINTPAFATTSQPAPMAGCERNHRIKTVSDGRSREQCLNNARSTALRINAASALKKVDLVWHRR